MWPQAEGYGGGNRDYVVAIYNAFPGAGTNETRVCRNQSRTFISETRVRRRWWIQNSEVLGSGSLNYSQSRKEDIANIAPALPVLGPRAQGVGDDMIFSGGV